MACIWTRGRGAFRADEVRVVPPDNCGDIILEVDDDGGLASCSVVGAMTRPLVPSTSPHHVMGIRFRPGWFAPTLGVVASELRDSRVPLQSVAPRLLIASCKHGSLHEWLACFPSLLTTVGPSARVREAMAHFTNGDTRVEAVCRALGVSRQWLAREFALQVGVGPKVFARVARVQRATEAGKRGEAWARIAARLEFADQSHLVREIQQLTGRLPGALSRSSRPDGEAALALVAAD